ncbi:MAG: cytochrome P450 [Pseudonocardiaceae bacterium]
MPSVVPSRAHHLDVTAADFDLGDPRIAEARHAHWYGHTPLGPIVLRYAEARLLLRDQRFGENGQAFLEACGVCSGELYDWLGSLLLPQTGNRHRALRGLVSGMFSTDLLARLRPFIRSAADRLVADLPRGQTVDASTAFADRLTTAVLCELIGVPAEDTSRFARWSTDLGLVYEIDARADALPRASAALAGLRSYVDDLVPRVRPDQDGSLLSFLVAEGRRDGLLTAAELNDLVVGLLFAAHDTTRHQIGSAVLTLASHPDQWSLLGRRPDLADQAVAEMLRWCPCVPIPFRSARHDLDWDSSLMRARDLVLVSIHSANRDPLAFDRPEEFDITRAHRSPILSFGAGPHYCVGMAVARSELAAALLALTTTVDPPELAGTVAWRRPLGIWGPESLPLRLRDR